MLNLLLSPLGRIAATVAGILAIIGMFGHYQQTVGVSKERARVEAKGTSTDAKAQAARQRAETDPHAALEPYYRR